MKYSAVLKCYDLTVFKGSFTAYVRLVPQLPNKYGCRTGQHPLLVFDILIEKDNICGLLAFQLLKNLWLLWNAKKKLGQQCLKQTLATRCFQKFFMWKVWPSGVRSEDFWSWRRKRDTRKTYHTRTTIDTVWKYNVQK